MKHHTHGLRLLPALAAILVAALPATAELILWSADILPDPNATGDGLTPADFVYATLSVDGGKTYLNVYSDGGDTGYAQVWASETGRFGEVYSGLIDPSSTGDLLIQFWDDSDTVVGSQSFAISTLTPHLWTTTGVAVAGGSPLQIQYVIPEPASGALLLAGAAMLAFGDRRRRAAHTDPSKQA